MAYSTGSLLAVLMGSETSGLAADWAGLLEGLGWEVGFASAACRVTTWTDGGARQSESRLGARKCKASGCKAG